MLSHDRLRLTLLRYFTGRLTQEECALFEERLLSDQEFSDAAAACEQEIIDAYARKSLDSETLNAIRVWIEASQSRMQRVSMARALLERKPQRSQRKQRVAILVTGLACTLALVMVTLDLAHRPMRWESKIGLPRIAGTPAVKVPAQSRPAIRSVKPDVILLVAEQIRGEEPAPSYRIHPGAPLQLQVILVGEKAFSGYTLKVASSEGRQPVLWEQKNLRAQSVDGVPYISVTFPPRFLAPGTYRAFVSRAGETFVSDFAVKW